MAQTLIALAGAINRVTSVAGQMNRVTAVTGTVYGFVTAVLTPWALDFSTEDHSSYVALL